MFGNSMTLPLVFMSSLLTGAPAERAVGYLALYQLAWSPMLWALGPRLLKPGAPDVGEPRNLARCQDGRLEPITDQHKAFGQLLVLTL
jgi:hypothetical protein